MHDGEAGTQEKQSFQTRVQGLLRSISSTSLRQTLRLPSGLPAAAIRILRSRGYTVDIPRTSKDAVSDILPIKEIPSSVEDTNLNISIDSSAGTCKEIPSERDILNSKQESPLDVLSKDISGVCVNPERPVIYIPTSTDVSTPKVMATLPPKDPDKKWRWGEIDVPGIVVHSDDGSSAYSHPPPSLRLDLGTSTPGPPLRKSPVTVQEWIDSLPSRPHDEDSPTVETPDASLKPSFDLTTEAELLSRGMPPSIVVDGPTSVNGGVSAMSPCENGVHATDGGTSATVCERRNQFTRARTTERMASFASDSAASNASSAGVESFLESRKLDPEKILLNLGFGGSQDSSGDLGLSRIPQRFLQPSQLKGISIADFYRHEMNLAETFETGFYGYRGLIGPSHKPSPIVAKIMERLRHKERDSMFPSDTLSVASGPTSTMTAEDTPSSPGLTPQQRFAAAAHRVQHSRSILTRLQSWKSGSLDSSGGPGGSVLNPDNRAFLQNQALSKSPEVPRRRLIMGARSYTFSGDGDLIECNKDDKNYAPLGGEILQSEEEVIPDIPPAKKHPPPRPPLVHKDSILSSNTSFSEESEDSDDDFRSIGRFRRFIHGSSLKRERPETPEISTATPPENPDSPVFAVDVPNKLKQRNACSYNKRLSSTSISSWESENWLPSPPFSSRLYHAFSSIDENSEHDLKRTDSADLKSTVIDEPDSAATSGLCSAEVSEPCNDSLVVNRRSSDTSSESIGLSFLGSSLASRRGSLKRQGRVSSIEEENLKIPESTSDEESLQIPSGDMTGVEEESAKVDLSRAGSLQSDSSGFQEGEAGAAASVVTAPAPVTADPVDFPPTPPVPVKEEITPSQATRLEQLERQMAQVASGLQAFRDEILTEKDPEAQAVIQSKVDQISGVLLHLKSLCEDLQHPSQQTPS